jgi:hypothetical protein
LEIVEQMPVIVAERYIQVSSRTPWYYCLSKEYSRIPIA